MSKLTAAVFCVNANLRRLEGEPFILDRTFRAGEDDAKEYVDRMKSMTGSAVLYRIETYEQGQEVPHQL
jgi:hypothetical protein